MTFLRNCWYLAAWSEELITGQLLARTIAGEPLVLFRTQAGTPAALLDACPHRFAPLSRGRLTPEGLQCGYHGLAFAADGRCVLNPHGAVTSALRARQFAMVDRHAALWVWLGEPERATAATIPDLGFIDRTAPAARVQGWLHRQASYLLMVDNIMDLSHADYVHPDTLGSGINTRTKGRVAERDGVVSILWHAHDDVLPPLFRGLMPNGEPRGDFHNEVYWYAPGVMKQRLRFGPTGQLETRGIDSWTTHTMTPETESSTHYFFCHTSDTVNADPSTAGSIKQLLENVFETEDGPMIEAQQRHIGSRDFWSLKPALLPIDSGAVRARRVLERLIEAETHRLDAEPQRQNRPDSANS
jgi:phenylpropionate dioxygenase-like ring-hydroxylating dioxygenase large terminal subunit